MAYEVKPGSFSLFPADPSRYKSSPPAFSGKGKDLEGVAIHIACWHQTAANGTTYLSCKISPVTVIPDDRAPDPAPAPFADIPDDLPW